MDNYSQENNRLFKLPYLWWKLLVFGNWELGIVHPNPTSILRQSSVLLITPQYGRADLVSFFTVGAGFFETMLADAPANVKSA